MFVNKPLIFCDLRCLQDPMYQYRGVGYHVAALLRIRRETPLAECPVVGLVDPGLPDLPEEFRVLCDSISPNPNQAFGRHGAIFIYSSPMTHDPGFTFRFLPAHERLLTAAVVYDFIPLD